MFTSLDAVNDDHIEPALVRLIVAPLFTGVMMNKLSVKVIDVIPLPPPPPLIVVAFMTVALRVPQFISGKDTSSDEFRIQNDSIMQKTPIPARSQ
jgi:hypothetical protein